MGMLQNGQWVDEWYDTQSSGGEFRRKASRFRNWVTADGAAGPTGKAGFRAEAGRYHLYVSLACPWAHRTLIFRQLKDLGELAVIDDPCARHPSGPKRLYGGRDIPEVGQLSRSRITAMAIGTVDFSGEWCRACNR